MAHELYSAAIAADNAFHAALVKAFGEKAAGDRRYDADESGWPDHLKAAVADFRQTTAAWIDAIREPVA